MKLQSEQKRIFVNAKDLGVRDLTLTKQHMRLQLNGTSYFYTCGAKEEYGENGYQVLSEKCIENKLKGKWHPVEMCKETECSFLKPLPAEKAKKEA